MSKERNVLLRITIFSVEAVDHLDERDIETLGELWEKAIPGTVSSPAWPL